MLIYIKCSTLTVRPFDQSDSIITFLTLLEAIMLNRRWTALHSPLKRDLGDLLDGLSEQIDLERAICKSEEVRELFEL